MATPLPAQIGLINIIIVSYTCYKVSKEKVCYLTLEFLQDVLNPCMCKHLAVFFNKYLTRVSRTYLICLPCQTTHNTESSCFVDYSSVAFRFGHSLRRDKGCLELFDLCDWHSCAGPLHAATN